MPQAPPKKPYLISNGDGTFSVDITKHWSPTAKQITAQNMVAPQRLLVGGVRSGKTAGAIMDDIEHGLLRYPKSNMLCLRRTFDELKSGPLEDFRQHCPEELYSYHQTDHIATFRNGSKLRFGHCKTGKERDIEQYLGTAYPWIVVDECAQFGPDAWNLLLSRNTVNPECMPDITQPCGGCGDPMSCGYPCLPQTHIKGCTNPFGEHWDWYHTTFVKKEPYEMPDGARRDKNGRYWVIDGIDEPRLVYEPNNYDYLHSTVLDNPHALQRDPGLIGRLNMLPPAMRDKMLLGYMEGGTGQYMTCFTEDNVVDLKDDPEAIVWEPWQPVFGGWDWALGSHWNACYFFTLALVKTKIFDKAEPGKFSYDYRRKIVCFKEYVTKDRLAREMATWIGQTLKYPNGEPVKKVAMISFSHEKFSRTVEEHTPADVVSQELMAVGLCPVSRGTTNVIGRATLMYQKLAHRELVIVKQTCPEIIKAIPNLMSDPDVPLKVLKPDGPNKADDCYDGFSLGLFGYFNPAGKPQETREQERLAEMDPLQRHFAKWKNTNRRQRLAETPRHRPLWTERIK